jgi:tetratricopeptide (TPR) repeat protein
MGCELRAVLPGFRSEPVNLAGRRFMDNPDVGTIILRRLANVDGYTFSMTTALAPKEAKKSYDKGLDLIRKKKFDEAAVEIAKATDAYPKYAVAWFDLGRLYEIQKKPREAIDAFQKALTADPKFVKPYSNLALLQAQQKDWERSAETSAKGIRLNPIEFPQLYYFNAIANLNLNKLDEAEKSAREASRLDARGQNPRIDQLLGVILAQKNDIKGAKESFQAFLKKAPDSPEAAQVRMQLARLDAPPEPAAPPRPAQSVSESRSGPDPERVATAPAAPPAPSAPVGRTAWPSWSSGISDLPPGTLSKEMDAAAIKQEVAGTNYSLLTVGDASQLKPVATETNGAAVAVAENLLVTNCDVMEKGSVTGLYQNGKLVPGTVRLAKSRREVGLCVLEVSGAKLQPVKGVRYAQDLNAGEKIYALGGEGTLQATRTQGGIKLLSGSCPVTPATSGGGLFDAFGNLIGVTTQRSQSAVIAVEEFYQ